MVSSAYQSLWDDAAVERRIEAGIERHRKADVSLRIEDAEGRPVAGAAVAVEQVGSPFLFGANLFMLGGYPTAGLNARYEEAFLRLFNAATIPFYWRGLEPVPGHPRFAVDSAPIPRRPPPDSTVAFCQKHGLNINGHPLVWDFIRWSAPDWLPDDPAKSGPLWEKRIREIAERYGRRIPRWDVVNEAVVSEERRQQGLSRRMPENYERLAFAWAQRYLPADAFLMINETTCAWGRDCQPYLGLIRRLRGEGAKIDGVGMQFHVFANEEMRRVVAGELHRPLDLLAALDQVGQLGLPVHVSEITLPALENDAAGQEAQARVVRNFYRLWFSHPAVHAITWWNLPDGGAAPGEDKLASGLLNSSMEPKPAYRALEDLICREWQTQCEAVTDRTGRVSFRGFHGRYRVRVEARAAEFDVTSAGAGSSVVRLSASKE